VPTFSQVYKLLQSKGPGRTVSSRETKYRIEARNGNILGKWTSYNTSRLLERSYHLPRYSCRWNLQRPLQHL